MALSMDLISQEFKAAASSSLDISASIEGGGWGYSGKFGYSDSSSAKEAKEFFQSGEGVMMISTAECINYKLRLNTYLLPGKDKWFLADFLTDQHKLWLFQTSQISLSKP